MNRLERYQLPLFFALSLLAWTIWVPQAARKLGFLELAPSLESPWNALTVWSPGIAAMLVTWRLSGGAGVRALFEPLKRWRVPLRWYLVAVLFEAAKWAAALGIDWLSGRSYELGSGALLTTFGASAAYMMPVAILFTIPNSLGEELGWRTFALPKLQARRGALGASIVLGLFWGFWHLPGWVAWGVVELSVLPVVVKVVNMVPVAIVFTWLFNNTRSSLLLVCLFHASIAARWYLLPALPTRTETALSWLVAVVIVVWAGPSRLQRDGARQPSGGGGLPARPAAARERSGTRC